MKTPNHVSKEVFCGCFAIMLTISRTDAGICIACSYKIYSNWKSWLTWVFLQLKFVLAWVRCFFSFRNYQNAISHSQHELLNHSIIWSNNRGEIWCSHCQRINSINFFFDRWTVLDTNNTWCALFHKLFLSESFSLHVGESLLLLLFIASNKQTITETKMMK